jgi:signal transduction histidine kinase
MGVIAQAAPVASAGRIRLSIAFSAARWLRAAGRAVLGVPLVTKIAGANVVILAGVIAAVLAGGWPTRIESVTLPVALLASLAVNVALIVIALEPLRALERTAGAMLNGDLTARVRLSVLGDRDLLRVAALINKLLDTLELERNKIRELGSRVVSAQDDERARIGREIQDSTAQQLAAVMYALRAEIDACDDGARRLRLEELLSRVGDALEELRATSHALYPRVLTDLGLLASLDWLARTMRERHSVDMRVRAARPSPSIPADVSVTFYRVAKEAVTNAVDHGGAQRVEVALDVQDGRYILTVADDGRGFDPAIAEKRGRRGGLAAIRERIGLMDGKLTILSRRGGGTLIEAVAPMQHAA